MNNLVTRIVPLKFQLGDFTLFSIYRRLQVRSIALHENIVPSESPIPPSSTPSPDCQGYALHCYPVAGNLPQINRSDGFIRYVPLRYLHCYIDLGTTFDQYQAKFSSKTRSTIKRKIARFTKACGGRLDWKSYRTSSEIDEFFAHARKVSKLTYQERLMDVGLPDAPSFRSTAKVQAATGNLRAFLLFDGIKPVSYLFCPVEDGVVIYAYLGYDPAYARMSVGTILQWLALEALFNESKHHFFDFTEGQSDHKKLFATHQRECANVYFLVDSLSNRLLVQSHLAMNFFSSWLGDRLDSLGLKTKIKQLIRRGR